MKNNQITRRGFIIGAAGLSAILGTISLAGCAGGGEPIVGTWQYDSKSYVRLKFEADGTFSHTNKHFTEFGDLMGKWYAYENNPVDVDGEKWYVYTTDTLLAPMYDGHVVGEGVYSDDIGGKYELGRMDFAVKGNQMFGFPGFLLAQHDKFDEERIYTYLSSTTQSEVTDTIKASYSFTRE